MVLALALAGGEAAWEAGAGAARLFRSTDIVLSHQSLQLLQRKESSESFNALLEMYMDQITQGATSGDPIFKEGERIWTALSPHCF